VVVFDCPPQAGGVGGVDMLLQHVSGYRSTGQPDANNESEVFDIIKPGRRVKIKGYRQ